MTLAALLHDLGHGPFSHVSEMALELYADRDKLKDRIKGEKNKIHELLTEDIIHNDRDLERLISSSERYKIVNLLSHNYGDPILKSVVSGPLDADKQDYLLRDSYFCGVKYGVFDMHQLHRKLKKVEDKTDGSNLLMISSDGTHALEQFVMAKYYLTTQVYSHRVRTITDQMIFRAIRMGVEEDKIDELQGLFKYDGTLGFITEYVKWDDARFLSFFHDDRFKSKYCYKFLTRLCQRKLLKRIYMKRLTELPFECRESLGKISKIENKKIREELEKRLYESIIGICNEYLQPESNDYRFFIVHAYSIKSVRVQSRNDEGPILVDTRQGPKEFEDESVLFKSINERINDTFVEVYAPVVYNEPINRRRLMNELDGPITRILSEFSIPEGENNENS